MGQNDGELQARHLVQIQGEGPYCENLYCMFFLEPLTTSSQGSLVTTDQYPPASISSTYKPKQSPTHIIVQLLGHVI